MSKIVRLLADYIKILNKENKDSGDIKFLDRFRGTSSINLLSLTPSVGYYRQLEDWLSI